jgi:hypothetical protein
MDDEFVKDLHLKRKIVREGTLAEYEKIPNSFIKKKQNCPVSPRKSNTMV